MGRKQTKELIAVIEEALSPGVFGPWVVIPNPRIPAIVSVMCETFGYGAMMHHIEALWQERNAQPGGHPGSEHTCAACALVRRDWIKRAQKALRAAQREAKNKPASKRDRGQKKKGL